MPLLTQETRQSLKLPTKVVDFGSRIKEVWKRDTLMFAGYQVGIGKRTGLGLGR